MKITDCKTVEYELKQYFSRAEKINHLQAKLDLFLKSREAVRQNIEDCRRQSKLPAPEYEKLLCELDDLDLEVLNINAKIREGHRRIIDVHYALEQLPEEEKNIITLMYREKLSLSKIGRAINMSKSSVHERRRKILRDISEWV